MASAIHRFQGLKALAYADHLRLIAQGGLPVPLVWHIYPTNRCPNDCTFCIMRKERQQAVDLDPDLLLMAVEQAAASGARAVEFSGGGEPLLHHYLVVAMWRAKTLGLKVGVTTNGVPAGLSPALARQVAEAADYIRLSLNAGDPDTYEQIHRAKNWRAAWNGGKMFSEYRGKADFGVAFVLVPENLDSLAPFLELAAAWKADFAHVRPAWWPERDGEIRAAAEVAGRQITALRAHLPHLQIHFGADKLAGKWSGLPYQECRATPLLAVVKANGRFCICQDRTDLTFGHVGRGFQASWLSSEHLEAMAAIRLQDCPRCVEGAKNELIEQAFLRDGLRLDLV